MKTKETIESHAASTGDKSEITADLACIACSYNLRGLTVNGRCPECGMAVVESVEPNPLTIRKPWRQVFRHAFHNALAMYSPGLIFFVLLGSLKLSTVGILVLVAPIALPSVVLIVITAVPEDTILAWATFASGIALILTTVLTLNLERKSRNTRWLRLAMACSSFLQAVGVIEVLRITARA